ncbi:MAG: hypothetical protein PV344_01650, partial [Anaplasma sp.]|nr:hypothetical protein [Anaplasma sp.]
NPRHSPDLVPSDFDLFRSKSLQGALGGRKFDTHDDRKAVVHSWLRNQSQERFPSASMHW